MLNKKKFDNACHVFRNSRMDTEIHKIGWRRGGEGSERRSQNVASVPTSVRSWMSFFRKIGQCFRENNKNESQIAISVFVLFCFVFSSSVSWRMKSWSSSDTAFQST